MDTEPRASAPSAMPPFWKSPQAIFMVIAGLAVAVGGPYLMWRSMGPHTKLSENGGQESVDSQPRPHSIDASLDLTELDTLPKSLHDGAMLLMVTDTPEHPDTLVNLPDPTSEDLLHPVTEAVSDIQPTLYWQPSFADPPYTVTVYQGSQIVTRGQGLANTSWIVSTPLMRGADYTWQLTSGATSAKASFHVLDDVQTRLWNSVKAAHPASHLVLGTVAEQLGMLGIAESEYTALAKDYPQSDTAARLLSNVQELRRTN